MLEGGRYEVGRGGGKGEPLFRRKYMNDDAQSGIRAYLGKKGEL